MRKTSLATALFAALVLGTSAEPGRAAGGGEPVAGPTREEPAVVSHHQITLGGKVLSYTAEAGRIAIRNVETGEPHGYIFYVAYRVPGAGKPRPVTFVWNGGPGADSATLHFHVAGPKIAAGDHLADNQDTWLTDTDLVFVDPVGTGFSRPAGPQYADEFYGTVGDVASVTEFVRAWRLLNDADDAPLYLAGESWGAGRAGSVGYALERRGVRVDGAALISGGSGLHADVVAPALAQALHVADLSATALHWGKASNALGKDAEAVRAKAEAWAREVYAPALEHPERLSDAERAKVVEQLAAFTGLSADQIDPRTLAITPRLYRTGLLKAEGKSLYVFDMRLTEGPKDEAGAEILRYFRRGLGYRTDLPYIGIERLEDGYAPSGAYPAAVNARWNYATAAMSQERVDAAIALAVKTGGGPPVLGPPLPSTAEAVGLNPQMKVLVAAGLYDSLNSCAANAETGKRLPPDLARAISFRCYGGGHMMYRDDEARRRLSADIREMVRGR